MTALLPGSALRPIDRRALPTVLVPAQPDPGAVALVGHRAASDFVPAARAASAQALTAAPLPIPAAGLRRGAQGAEVLKLQRALQRLGFLSKAQIATGPGVFGPRTQRALQAFQTKHHISAIGVFGPLTRAALARALGQATPSLPPPSGTAVSEPAHDYRRVSFRGVQVDVRTRDMISRAEAKLKAMGTPMQLQFSQGSFSSSVAASGSTHDGGGALDIRTRGQSSATVDRMVKVLRSVGFAAWSRGRGHDNFAPHIHAIAIGDQRLSSGARWQVREYFRGHSGLTAQGADADRSLGHPYPAWAAKYR